MPHVSRRYLVPALAALLPALCLGPPPAAAAPFGVPLGSGDSVTTAISPAGDSDAYVFEAFAGSRLAVSVAPARGSALLPALSLRDPAGNEVDLSPRLASRRGKLTLKKLALESTGYWTLLVSGDSGATGEYVLKLKVKPPRRVSVKGLPLAAGEAHDFSCGAREDTRISVTVKAKKGRGFAVTSVFGPGGAEIAGGVEAFTVGKGRAKAVLYASRGFGDYGFRVENGGEDAVLSVVMKLRHPRAAGGRRKLVLDPLEPSVDSLDPPGGAAGAWISIRGENFREGARAFFGGEAAPATVFVSAAEVRARVPEGTGTVDVTVVNPDGQFGTLAGAFLYRFLETHSVSGTVSGDASAGVTLTLSGDDARVTTSVAGGGYLFTGVLDGTYTITPSRSGFRFEPPSREVVVSGADVSAVDFTAVSTAPSLDTSPPSGTVRLVFVHHSCGSNWLSASNGGLGDELGKNHYYVRDTNYGWDAPENTDIGSSTDIGHWYTWFADTTVQGNAVARRDNILGALYTTNAATSGLYTPITDPGGENEIIMFKSCFPNSNVRSDNGTTPSQLFGQSSGSSAHTLSNCKAVYRELLKYMKTRTDKMFVVVTAPPLVSGSTDATRAANARALNDWLVHDWLSPAEGDWENRNVYVFDFFNVLTDENNHHRVYDGAIQHDTSHGNDYAAYGQGGDSHPNSTGNRKSTAEFVPLLNVWYHRWQASK